MTDLHVYRHHCWACQLNRCPHEPHDWADGDDIDAAARIRAALDGDGGE